MKDMVLSIVKSNLSGANDNLHRAQAQFKNLSEKELNRKYGGSDSTCGEILSSYQDKVSELKRCVIWVETAK